MEGALGARVVRSEAAEMQAAEERSAAALRTSKDYLSDSQVAAEGGRLSSRRTDRRRVWGDRAMNLTVCSQDDPRAASSRSRSVTTVAKGPGDVYLGRVEPSDPEPTCYSGVRPRRETFSQ